VHAGNGPCRDPRHRERGAVVNRAVRQVAAYVSRACSRQWHGICVSGSCKCRCHGRPGRAVRYAAIVAGGAALTLASYGLGAGVASLVPVGSVPASQPAVPAQFCPAGTHVIPAPYLTQVPQGGPECERGRP
jgi:hypothetical protein